MADEVNINILDESITIELQDKEDFVLELNEQGPQGATGPQGPQGIQGIKGDKGEPGRDGVDGEPGPANTLSIGTVTGGTTARATITGDSPNQTLNLVLPKGDKGDRGEQGIQGIQGVQGDIGPRGISVTGVEQISKVGLIATYRMYFSDGTNFEYEVTDGSVEGITRSEIIDKLGFEPASYTSVEEINDLIPNEATTNNKLADKAWVDGEISSIDSRVDMVVDDLGELSTKVESNTINITYIDEKVRDIELFKFPNAVIIGDPTIQNGQISGFSTVSYLQFPFILDLHNQAFQIDFSFTTTTNVQTQQNILDSNFGLALAIQNGKGVMAISSNGTSWDIGSAIGNVTIQSNTTYYARLLWNRLQYKTQLSTDGVNYVDDMVITDTRSPYPRTMFIGGCDQIETGHTGHPFLGTINMNKASLSVMGNVIWQGMDDAGLATRADLSLSNLDELGEKRFTDLQTAIDTKANNSDLTAHTNNGTIHVTANDKISWSQKQPLLVSGTNIKTINNTSVLGSGNIDIRGASSFAELEGQPEDNANLKNSLDSKIDIASLSEIKPMIVSYVNGTSGYNIWSNGYCEQWGFDSNIAVSHSITLLKTFKYTDYNIQVSWGSDAGSSSLYVSSKKINSFSTYGRQYSGSASGSLYWKACGYLAEGEY